MALLNEEPETFPKLSMIFDVEDKLRRNRTEYKVLKWEHRMLLMALTDGRRAEIEQTKSETELQLKELEIQSKRIALAKEVIDLIAPPDLPLEQRYALASQLMSELNVLSFPKFTFDDPVTGNMRE